MAKSLFEHYDAITRFGGMAYDNQGFAYDIARSQDGKKDYVLVNNKRLALPTVELLRKPDEGDIIFFHPFAEEYHKGESPVITELRRCFGRTIANSVTSYMMQMIMLASSDQAPTTLDPRQQDGIRAIKECSASVASEISKVLLASLKPSSAKKIERIQLYLSRKGKVDGVSYLRSLTVRFPLYEAVVDQGRYKKTDRNLFSVKLSDAAISTMTKLYEMLFPKLKDKVDAYSTGSNSDISPYSDALLRGCAELVNCINEAVGVYEDIGEFKDAKIDDSWMDVIDAMPSLHKEILLIPAPGDTAGLEKIEDKMARENSAPVAVEQSAAISQQPTAPIHTAAPVQTHAPVAAPAAYHQPQAVAPAYHQPMTPAPAPAQVAEGKADFRNMVAPGVAGNAHVPQYYGAPVQPQTQLVQMIDPNTGRPAVDQYGRPIMQQVSAMPVNTAPVGTPSYMMAAAPQVQQPHAGGGYNPYNGIAPAPQQVPQGYGVPQQQQPYGAVPYGQPVAYGAQPVPYGAQPQYGGFQGFQ